jgi:hypothetical protein
VAEVKAVEMAMVLEYRVSTGSNDPAICYDRRPRFDALGSIGWAK